MTPQQIEALKMALEVMRNQGDVSVDEWIATEKAIKEALAQPEQEPVAWEQFYDPKRVQDMLQDVLTMGSAWSRGGERIDPMNVYKGFEPEARPKPPWSQKTIEQKIEASIRHYKKEIERAKEVGDPHQFVGTYEGFVVCLESILEKNA